MIHYSTKHEVKKTFKNHLTADRGMENGNGCIHAKFSKHGKNSHTWSIYNIIYTHTSQFLGCSSKSKYSTWIRYTILQYTTRFSNQLCKIPMWLPFRINNISPKKSDSQFQMLDLKIEVTPEKPKLSEFWKSTDYSQFSGVQK